MPATITLVGRIVHKPETKELGSTTVTKVRVPSDVGFGDRKTTTWWNIEVWGVTGERLAKFANKGDVVFFSGEPCVREYERQDGNKGFVPEIKSASWGFVPRPSDNSASEQSAPVGSPQAQPKTDLFNDDIPF